jgi:hypothetical protein
VNDLALVGGQLQCVAADMRDGDDIREGQQWIFGSRRLNPEDIRVKAASFLGAWLKL